MKKNLSLILFLLVLIQLAALPVNALDIVINKNGSVYFYEDQVLGDESEDEVEVENEEENEQEKADEKKEEKVEEKKNEEKKEERTDKPIRIVPSANKEKIRLRNEENKTEVSVEKKRQENKKDTFENKSVTKSERVEVEMSAELKERVEERAKRMELRADSESSPAGDQKSAEEIREERRNRKEEKIEIRAQRNENGEQEFEFESRLVKAKARGAEFVLDPETNNVTVITPSGNEHVLTHLPDQAIIQLQASGIIDTQSLIDGTSELEIETTEDGRVVYKAKTKKPKKIFGIFRREIETEVELDDQTGQVTEEEVVSDSFFGRLLNSMAR